MSGLSMFPPLIGEVIEGWDVGVSTMRKSELARFLVNPSYAFGDFGCPPRIPPGATSMYFIGRFIREQCVHKGPSLVCSFAPV